MSKNYKYKFLLVLFPIQICGCDLLISEEDASVLSTSPYPMQQSSEERITTYTFSSSNISEFDDFASNYSDDYYPDVLLAIEWILDQTAGQNLLVNFEEVSLPVNDVVFYSYCNWYEPNSTLDITLSSINESSVSTSITVSVEASLGISLGGDSATGDGSISGSISRETTQTVTTSQGIEVTTSYDLTQYDQSKLYKAILTGKYTIYTYAVTIDYGMGPIDIWDQNSMGIIITADKQCLDVDQDSLTVKLVYKN